MPIDRIAIACMAVAFGFAVVSVACSREVHGSRGALASLQAPAAVTKSLPAAGHAVVPKPVRAAGYEAADATADAARDAVPVRPAAGAATD